MPTLLRVKNPADWLFIAGVAAVVLLLIWRGFVLPVVPLAALPSTSGSHWIQITVLPDHKDPGYRDLLREATSALREHAASRDVHFATVGVHMGAPSKKTLEMLRYYGPFDEISAGRNWGNTAVVKYVWRDVPGVSAVPQLIVVTEHMEITPTYITVGLPKLLIRVAGLPALRDWGRGGYSIEEE